LLPGRVAHRLKPNCRLPATISGPSIGASITNSTAGRDLACDRANYTDFYRKIAVTWSIACSNDFIVWLKFGEDDRLVSARNGVYSICL